ncbi:MAG TPA: RnfABCDGE type electron transport complex subunit D [Tepidisphaeraceae bacterium]|nr:RnfABCDGE type electron transport complex subunit D [Tepidisphaeraceae bacterium]
MSDSAASTTIPPTGVSAPKRRLRTTQLGLMHGGMSVPRYISIYLMGAIFPIITGILFFGWRALGAIIVVVFFSAAAIFVWRKIGTRGAHLRYDHALWMSLLLALMLPGHLYSAISWPVLASAGILLVIFIWLIGGVGSGRIHPVLITYLVIFVFFKSLLVPHYVLQRRDIFMGDILRNEPANFTGTTQLPWIQALDLPQFDSVTSQPASQTLSAYTSGAKAPDRAWISLDALLRDRMPPLEDLIVGGHPAPIGSGGAIAIIIGGLFLLYHGLIDFRVPLFIFLAAMIAMLLLPVPVVLKENEAVWRWVPMHMTDVGWQIGLTLANYELMAGPLTFMAFFLATSPSVRPIARRARIIYGLLIGLLTAVFQLYISVTIGAYLALIAVSLFTPTLDKWFKPRTLV